MKAAALTEADLRREIADYRERYPKLGDDELFVLWFLRAFVTDDESQAVKALCGGGRDKGVDAVFIDDAARIVFIVQGKYRQKVGGKGEHRTDVTSFSQLAVDLGAAEKEGFSRLTRNLSPEVQGKLEQARDRVRKRGYSLHLYYVTLGRCSKNLLDEAARIARSSDISASFELLDGKRILLLLADYLDGVAPPVPSLDLEIESGGGVRTGGVFNRYDGKTDIESWVFAMTDVAIGALFARAGTRLFARNVRGFLGSTEINRGMEATLEKEPEFFWYYNNGITIVCDDARQESSRGRNILRVTNPQVINGQQTTRTLSNNTRRGPRASALVRVIRVPREPGVRTGRFDTLVSRIVGATNWQNAIRPSDLMSNDRRQIEIERQFRKLNYQYMRKRMTKGEVRRAAGVRHLRLVKKEEIAQAVAATELDPSVVREGKERLFEERWYGQVFPTAEPNFYLSRYRLLRLVSWAARGYPERAYAKWLVMHFVWHRLEPLCRARARADAFRVATEKDFGPLVGPLIRAIDAVYTSSLSMYRRKRGTGRRAVDVSTFFKRRRLHAEFEKHWKRADNRSRAGFTRAWASFERALENELAV